MGSRSLLFLTSDLSLGEFEGYEGHVIPGIVDADEQQQHRCRGDGVECLRRLVWKQTPPNDECAVGDQRQDRLTSPHG